MITNTLSSNISAVCASLAFFRGVEPVWLRRAAEHARVVSLRRGENLWDEGSVLDRFWIVLDGWVGLLKTSQEGKEAVIHALNRDRWLPSVDDVLRAKPAYSAARALGAATLLELPIALVRDMIKGSSPLMDNVLCAEAAWQKRNEQRIEELLLCDAEERVRRFLLRIRHETKAGMEIKLPFDKALIASYLGIKPETFSRILASLRDDGFVTSRHSVTLLTDDALCGVCQEQDSEHCTRHMTDMCRHHRERV